MMVKKTWIGLLAAFTAVLMAWMPAIRAAIPAAATAEQAQYSLHHG